LESFQREENLSFLRDVWGKVGAGGGPVTRIPEKYFRKSGKGTNLTKSQKAGDSAKLHPAQNGKNTVKWAKSSQEALGQPHRIPHTLTTPPRKPAPRGLGEDQKKKKVRRGLLWDLQLYKNTDQERHTSKKENRLGAPSRGI